MLNMMKQQQFRIGQLMSYDELIEARQKVLGIGNLNLFYVLRDVR